MCRRLAQAGALLEAEGEEAAAFDRYFRAVRSRFVSGDDYADYLAAARRVGRQAELQALLEPFTEGPEAPAPL